MGFRIPPPPTPNPVPAGNACTNCWGSGKPFGDGSTPDQIVVSVSGIVHGPNWIPANGEAPEGEFVADQLPGTPCQYLYNPGAGFDIEIKFLVATTTASIFIPFGIIYFSGVVGVCETFLENTENDRFTGGSVKITIPKVLL